MAIRASTIETSKRIAGVSRVMAFGAVRFRAKLELLFPGHKAPRLGDWS